LREREALMATVAARDLAEKWQWQNRCAAMRELAPSFRPIRLNAPHILYLFQVDLAWPLEPTPAIRAHFHENR
jgi:hypothetical protein